MPEGSKVLKEGEARFSSDTQLLPELGERLFASPQVALAELVKNSYDADAVTCHIWLENDGEALVIQDNGHGMAEQEFLDYWMTVATVGKLRTKDSRRHSRPVTGSKGVGRFAVRHLGRDLTLETVAEDPSKKKYLKLTAAFDWDAFTPGQKLESVAIKYRVEEGFSREDVGTRLIIRKLQREWTPETLKTVTQGVLDLVSHPFEASIGEVGGATKQDPGFSLYFCRPGEETPQESATRELVERYLARVQVRVQGKKARFKFEYHGKDVQEHEYALGENLVGDIRGEIRYFPRRPGLFLGMQTMDGRQASRWLRDNGGVRIIDRGFRVPPYGERDDDWLRLDASKATNERAWRSAIAEALFPAEKLAKEGEASPFLYLPTSHQLLGAVYVRSYRPDDGAARKGTVRGLQITMDRHGFVENEAFDQLTDIVRGAVELLAVVDVDETRKERLRNARAEAREAQQVLARAIEQVKTDRTIRPQQKRQIIESYKQVAKQVSKMETAYEEARQTIEAMYLLGVLAAFMTHETTVMLRATERMVDRLKRIQKRIQDPELDASLSETTSALESLHGHVDYTKAFLGALREGKAQTIKVRAQASYVMKQFQAVTEPRTVRIENKVPADLLSPPINTAVYSGILLNLYTNAIKAVLAVEDPGRERVVRIEAENSGSTHIVRVSDTGVGIPTGLEDRIFEPLFTTTGTAGPLGTGMGLGLYVVKKLLSEIGGSIGLVSPPDGFTTCIEFRIRS